MDVVVIGGGQAGVTTAWRVQELDASVALVERGCQGGIRVLACLPLAMV